MTAPCRKTPDCDIDERVLLLPWYVAGTLGSAESARLEQALAEDAELARHYAAILEERAAAVELNESLGAPSARAMDNLFAAIDAQPVARPARPPRFGWLARLIDSLSPRTLAWSGTAGALALLVQGSVIGALLLNEAKPLPVAGAATPAIAAPAPDFTVAALPPLLAPQPMRVTAVPPMPLSRSIGPQSTPPSSVTDPLAARLPTEIAPAPTPATTMAPAPRPAIAEPTTPPRALVRFAPDARIADIAALLDAYGASIVGSAQGGLFRVQFGASPISKQEADAAILRLRAEPIVSLAVSSQ